MPVSAVAFNRGDAPVVAATGASLAGSGLGDFCVDLGQLLPQPPISQRVFNRVYSTVDKALV